MEAQYDFSGAERGKFYRQGAVFDLPIHIAPELRERLQELAKRKGMTPSDLANEFLKRGLESEATREPNL